MIRSADKSLKAPGTGMAFLEVPPRIRTEVGERAAVRDLAPEKGRRTLLKPRWVGSDIACRAMSFWALAARVPHARPG